MMRTINRLMLLLATLLLSAVAVTAEQEQAVGGWATYSDPAMLMYPLRFPVGWSVKPLSQQGISLLRASAKDGSAAMELYTGLHHGAIDARGLARSAIANLLGSAEPEGTKVFRDSRRKLQGAVGEIAIRGVLVGPRAGIAIAMVGRSGQVTLAHYRVILAPQQDPEGVFDRLLAEHFSELKGPVLPK